MSEKTLGLALGAGGTRGIAHIGFLKFLEENKIKPSFIAGSSMGALVGACYSKGIPLDEIKQMSENLKAKDIIDISLQPITRRGILRCHKVRALLEKVLENANFEDLNIPFSCVALDILSGEGKIFNKGKLIEAVLGSCSIPSIFRPVEFENMLLIDGGVVNRVPVDIVKNMGAEVVIGVDVLGKFQELNDVNNLIGLILRTYDIMDYNSTNYNKEKNKKIIDLWIEPSMPGISQYRVKDVEKCYDAGYKAAKDNFEEIEKLIKG